MPTSPAAMTFRRIGSAASATTATAARQRRGDRRALAQQRRQQRDEAQRHREVERPRRRDRVAGEIAGGVGQLPAAPEHDAAAEEVRRRRAACRRRPRSARIAAANAWSVSRNASSRCQRTGSEATCGAIAALYIARRSPMTKQASTMTGDRRARRVELRGEDLRGAREHDRRQAQHLRAASRRRPPRRRRRPARTGSARTRPAACPRPRRGSRPARTRGRGSRHRPRGRRRRARAGHSLVPKILSPASPSPGMM